VGFVLFGFALAGILLVLTAAAHAESVLENLAFASCLAKHLPGSVTYAEPITYYSYFRATSGSTRMARRAGM
jgi:hypothetical protein